MKKHAWMIIAHNNFEQLKMLCDLLNDDRNNLFIMIDAKVSDPPTVVELLPNTRYADFFFTERVNVIWGGYSQIKAELTLLEAALNSGEVYEYYHLLSGTDLPLKSNDEICKFFDQNNGKEFLHFSSKEFLSRPSVQERASLYHFFQEKAGRNKESAWFRLERWSLSFQRHFGIDRLKNLTLYCGSNWFSITKAFAEYVVSNKAWIKRTFSKGCCVDELFLQTLIMNSPFKDYLYRADQDNDCHGNMRFVDWKRGKPYTWKSEDFDELVKSDYLFARKFDISADRDICERIFFLFSAKETDMTADRLRRSERI